MRNAFKRSQLTSKNFVKRVLSKTNSLNASDIAIDKTTHMEEEKPPVNIEMELFSLKKQIDGLQKSINSMQYDNEKKETALAKLARDKEQLHMDLNKQRRSNSNLKQQLEDERKFYFQEKEQYCIEMNETKKIKQKLNETNLNSDNNLKELFREKEESLQIEIQNLKERINITLEANYNLSVKFLRMKNTKFCLKNQLKRLQLDHNTAMEEFGLKLERVVKELAEIVHKEFLSPITPSSKKYLQLIKYNGQLIHENLALQQQTERLQQHLDKIKMQQVREETNQKLQYYKKRSRSEGASILSHRSQVDKNAGNDNSNQMEIKKAERMKEKMELVRIGPKKCENIEGRNPSTPALPIIPMPLRTSPSLDIQTLYERKKSFHRSQHKLSLVPNSTKQCLVRSAGARARDSSLSIGQTDEYSPSCPSSITIQPLDNSKAVTLPADVVPSCNNLRLLCRSENEGSEGACSSGEGADSREASSNCGRRMNSSTCTEAMGTVSSMNLLQVSNSISNQDTEMSYYTSNFYDSRPQSAPAAGARGTNTGND